MVLVLKNVYHRASNKLPNYVEKVTEDNRYNNYLLSRYGIIPMSYLVILQYAVKKTVCTRLVSRTYVINVNDFKEF